MKVVKKTRIQMKGLRVSLLMVLEREYFACKYFHPVRIMQHKLSAILAATVKSSFSSRSYKCIF